MKPIDKFGRPIYPHIYKKIRKTGMKLERYGYIEAKKSPNLFYLRTKSVIFYADLRGTDMIAIWENTDPVFYWKWIKKDLSLEQMERLKNLEIQRLKMLNIPVSVFDVDCP